MATIPFDELKESVALSAIIGETLRLTRRGREFVALCPFHNERTASFSVNDTKRIYHCFGCGAQGDVFDWLRESRGMTIEQAAEHLGHHRPLNGHNGKSHASADTWMSFPPPSEAWSPDLTEFDAAWAYTDPDGKLVRYIARRDGTDTKRKQYVPFTWGSLNGETGWFRKQSVPPRELYGLVRLTRKPAAPVLICEGEKAADAAQTLFPGFACVTWSGGSDSVHQNRWEVLKGRDVVIWPDNDAAGARAADELEKLLRPIATRLRRLNVASLPEKGDAADLTVDDPDAWLTAALPAPETPRFLTAAAFMSGFVPPDYVVDGIIRRGMLYSLTSPTGHGKTAVALYFACMVAIGRNIGAIEVTRGPVVFLAGENPDDLRTRMFAACQTYGIKARDLDIHVLPATFPIGPEAAEQLRVEINALACNPVLVIVDTAAAFFQGDNDNDNVQMGAYARNLRLLTTCQGSPAVLTPAHPVKNADRENLLPRGGGAFLNEVDGNLALWATIMGEAATLHWQGKIRGPEFAPVDFTLEQVRIDGLADQRGRQMVSIIARLQTADQAEAAIASAISDENVVLELLRRHPGISIRNLADNAGWMLQNGTPHKSKVQRLLRNLAGDKLVRKWRSKWQITDLGKAELSRKRDD